MGLSSLELLSVKITDAFKDNILEEVQKYLKKFKVQSSKFKNKKVEPLTIFTPNPEIINYAQQDKVFKRIVNSAQINIPDGAGIVWAINRIYHKKVKRLSGTDLFQDLVILAEKEGYIIGLIGGKGGVALKTLECLKRKYPKLKGEVLGEPEVIISNIKSNPKSKDNLTMKSRHKVGIHDAVRFTRMTGSSTASGQYNNAAIKQLGGDGINKLISETVKKINRKKIDIIFVALGCPKQEYFIDRIKYYVLSIKYDKPLILMGVGGSFDYISGRVRRAPQWLKNRGLEWLYRLVREPWRLGRQMRGAGFFIRILLYK